MIEMLCRGKRVDTGEWVYGFYVFLKKRKGAFGQTITDADFDRHTIYTLMGEQIEVIPETVGEYTGKMDANEKKIFEGDIVDFVVFDCFDNDTSYRGVVRWSDAKQESTAFMIWHDDKNEYYGPDGGWELGWVHWQDSELEVIGNIYDNPELLENNK